MSAMLLLDKFQRPTGAPDGHYYADDLESYFHCLIHEIVVRLPLNFSIQWLHNFIPKYFDQSEMNEDEGILNGGERKSHFFVQKMEFIVQNNEPLTQLIADLRDYFKDRYYTSTPEEATALLEGKYGSSKAVVDMIDAALVKEGWPEEDKLEQDVFHRDTKGHARPGSALKRKATGDGGQTLSGTKRAKSKQG
jgi:hypothetical protein